VFGIWVGFSVIGERLLVSVSREPNIENRTPRACRTLRSAKVAKIYACAKERFLT
jgi:hypothetical protein